jgi:hypothetical protein
MLIRGMTEADAGEVSALIFRSYDRVLVHYHSPKLVERFRRELLRARRLPRRPGTTQWSAGDHLARQAAQRRLLTT